MRFNVSQCVKKCHKVSQNTNLEMVWWVVVSGGVGGWKPILVYSSGPTFELELELESDLTWPDLTWPCPDLDPDLDLDLEWDLEWDLELDHNHLGAKCQKTENSGFLQYFLKKKYFFTRLLASCRVPSLSFNLVERKGQDIHTQS